MQSEKCGNTKWETQPNKVDFIENKSFVHSVNDIVHSANIIVHSVDDIVHTVNESLLFDKNNFLPKQRKLYFALEKTFCRNAQTHKKRFRRTSSATETLLRYHADTHPIPTDAQAATISLSTNSRAVLHTSASR